jgi:hypothetical protein
MASEIRRRNVSGGALAPYPSARSPRNNHRALSGEVVTEEEADAILMQLMARDDDSKKTWSRICVEKFFSKVRYAVTGEYSEIHETHGYGSFDLFDYIDPSNFWLNIPSTLNYNHFSTIGTGRIVPIVQIL